MSFECLSDLAVEVCCSSDTPAAAGYGEAYVIDFTETEVEVRYRQEVGCGSDQLSPVMVPYSHVYPVSCQETEKVRDLNPGDECEVLLLNSDGIRRFWYTATVRTTKGEFVVCVVEKGGSGGPTNEIVDYEKIRPVSARSALKPGCLFRLCIPLSQGALEMDMSAHETLKRRVPNCALSVNRETRTLNVIALTQESMRRAQVMADIHLKCLESKCAMIKKTQAVAKQLQQFGAEPAVSSSVQAVMADNENMIVDEFVVPEHLLGLVIGTQGSNIQHARSFEGISSVEILPKSTVRIIGRSKQCVKQARSILEFTEGEHWVRKDAVPKIIGKNGTGIQNIIEKAGVLRARFERVENMNEDELQAHPNDAKVVFVGTVDAIENAKELFDFNQEHIDGMDVLYATLNQLNLELKRLEPVAVAAAQNAQPRPRRPAPFSGGNGSTMAPRNAAMRNTGTGGRSRLSPSNRTGRPLRRPPGNVRQ